MTTPLLMILAQNSASPRQPSGMGMVLFPLLAMGLIFYFLVIRPQGRDKKRRAEMLSQVKRNDRVVTIGGILGTVTAVKDDEITLKVDESTNTKITFSRAAIQRVNSAEAGAGSLADAGK